MHNFKSSKEKEMAESATSSTSTELFVILKKSSKLPLLTAQLMGYFPFWLENTGKSVLLRFSWFSVPFAITLVHTAFVIFARTWFFLHVDEFRDVFHLKNDVETFGWAISDLAFLFGDLIVRGHACYYRKQITLYFNKLYFFLESNIWKQIDDNCVYQHQYFKLLLRKSSKPQQWFLALFVLNNIMLVIMNIFVVPIYISKLGLIKGIIYCIGIVLYNILMYSHILKMCLYNYIIDLLRIAFEMLKVLNSHTLGKVERHNESILLLENKSNYPPSYHLQLKETKIGDFITSFQSLEKFVSEFNVLFGIPIIFCLITLAIFSMHYIFLCWVLVRQGQIWAFIFIGTICVNISALYWICSISSKMTNEARDAISTLIGVSMELVSRGLKQKVQMLYQKGLSWTPAICPNDFFYVNRQLATTILGTLITYCIILLQFRGEARSWD